ncbi:MAG: hypothetical protein KJ906_02880 [Nanoarchaeota archaeon]|nr:hypothetical protein [Nanoarchaeota archaeon]
MKTLKWYIAKEFLIKMPSMKSLTDNFLEKARKNLTTMSILLSFKTNKQALKLLNVPEDYSPNEWIATTAYYSMYMASLAALARIGYKSKNHIATTLALEEFYVKKGLLEKEILELIEKARLEVSYIDMIRTAKDKREIAQYSPTKKTVDSAVEDIRKDAYKFVERIEKLISDLSEE